MTAINIIKQADRVHMITDGLTSDGFIVSKVIPLPHLRTVIACSGTVGAGLMIAAEACQADSYDEVKRNIGQIMHHCEAMYPRQMITHTHPDYEIYVAGISETSGSDFYFAVNHKRRRGVQRYSENSPAGDVLLQPCDPGIAATIFQSWKGKSPASLDPLAEGPTMIEFQRKFLNHQFPNQIGGLCLVTTVTRDNIVQTVPKRWPLHQEWGAA
ncbi:MULTISPECIES: hypothetical protein [unclassified Afipia]|uniref:hypothetical protein n=1 Tax=unclassified Afipia TaxID=2642050 RepID=UPI000466926B|nr:MULTISPECIES: hypothetical protein [unclassified Afipia]